MTAAEPKPRQLSAAATIALPHSRVEIRDGRRYVRVATSAELPLAVAAAEQLWASTDDRHAITTEPAGGGVR